MRRVPVILWWLGVMACSPQPAAPEGARTGTGTGAAPTTTPTAVPEDTAVEADPETYKLRTAARFEVISDDAPSATVEVPCDEAKSGTLAHTKDRKRSFFCELDGPEALVALPLGHHWVSTNVRFESEGAGRPLPIDRMAWFHLEANGRIYEGYFTAYVAPDLPMVTYDVEIRGIDPKTGKISATSSRGGAFRKDFPHPVMLLVEKLAPLTGRVFYTGGTLGLALYPEPGKRLTITLSPGPPPP